MRIQEVEKFLHDNRHKLAELNRARDICPLIHRAARIPKNKLDKLMQFERHYDHIMKVAEAIEQGSGAIPREELTGLLQTHLEQLDTITAEIGTRPELAKKWKIDIEDLLAHRAHFLDKLSEANRGKPVGLSRDLILNLDGFNECMIELHLGQEMHERYQQERDSFFQHLKTLVNPHDN
ncbi:MAG: hypothetical protein Q8R15_03445 [Candidatus Micrarchaeota archaeon]|nr:hypothetical protein [Candidatus Micrarchaeota archaeon]